MQKLTATIVAYQNYSDIQKTIEPIEKYTDKNISKKIYVVDNGVAVSDPDELSSFMDYIQKI